ncbi:YchJ family metal-binding protein [Ramlibacter sp. PS3R-8]|uniref:YchJ family protein n=1 Tax=Ramlibacter sp. PS3R-8 TaxID=3133437 RepID=UPI003095067B
MTAEGPCPCGGRDARQRPRPFARCCGPLLADFDHEPAPDAEALMRSRYCAFVLEDGDYLLATWHPSRRPPSLAFEPGLKWLGLEVRDHRVVDATHAEVEFLARSRLAGRAQRLHERSRFVCDDGRWYYLDGDLK